MGVEYADGESGEVGALGHEPQRVEGQQSSIQVNLSQCLPANPDIERVYVSKVEMQHGQLLQVVKVKVTHDPWYP
jgi:hypothetical protein